MTKALRQGRTAGEENKVQFRLWLSEERGEEVAETEVGEIGGF